MLESILTDAVQVRFRLEWDEGNETAIWRVLGFPTESKLQSPLRNIEGSRVHPPGGGNQDVAPLGDRGSDLI
jgi:hypothetical protein